LDLDPSTAFTALLTILGGFLAGSGGFWVYLKKKYEREDCVKQLVMGLAHDKIIELSLRYIEKGFVTKDEYDDLFKYFWDPYSSVGGNGSAERIVGMVRLLPLTAERRGTDRKVREATEKLISGADKIIDKVENGEDDFDRPK
jgi:hypothetical protein